MRIIGCLIFWLLVPSAALAQSEVDLGIRSTFANRIPMAISPFAALDGARRDDAVALEQLVYLDLEFTGVFKIVRGQVPLAGNGDNEGLVEVRGALFAGSGRTEFEGRVVDVASGQTIGAKRYVVNEGQTRQVAHHFSDEVVRMLTGELGIATTRILYRREAEGRWEIVMSDYDGYNPRVLIRQTVPVIFPRWIEKAKAIVYSSFRYGKPDLYLRYVKESGSTRIVSFEGMNYSVDWCEKRKELAATLSKDGNAEIYILTKNGKVKRRLTHNRSIDISPSWSPSGREILFTSDRSGRPNIYLMEAGGGNVRRLTFQGNYNESPAWSPKGDRVAFVSRIDGFFQLCTIRPDGTDLRVITSESGDHEDPRWAPNGRHIVYTHTRGGQSLISMIDIFTGGTRILAEGDTPDWSVR